MDRYWKRIQEIYQKDGLRSVATKSARKVYRDAYSRLMFPRVIQKSRYLGESASNDDLFQFVFGKWNGLIEPLQRKPEIGALMDLVRRRRPKVYVEIGTAKGGTLFLLSRCLHPQALIISIDLFEGEFGGGYPNWKQKFYREFALPGQTIHLLRANSHLSETKNHLSELLGGREIDVLLIDGDHTYEGVKVDYEMYSPLVKNDGVVAFHDIVPHLKDPSCQVDKFWREVKSANEEIAQEFIADPNQTKMGIGVLDRSAAST